MSAYGAYVKRKIGDVIFQRVYKYEIPEICHTLLLNAKALVRKHGGRISKMQNL